MFIKNWLYQHKLLERSMCFYRAIYGFRVSLHSEFPECHRAPCLKQAQHLKIKRLQRDSNPTPLNSWTNNQLFSPSGQLNEWVLVYKLKGCGLEVRCSHSKILLFLSYVLFLSRASTCFLGTSFTNIPFSVVFKSQYFGSLIGWISQGWKT